MRLEFVGGPVCGIIMAIADPPLTYEVPHRPWLLSYEEGDPLPLIAPVSVYALASLGPLRQAYVWKGYRE